MISVNEEDYLPISGLQHFLFCKRQWALIHIEGLWVENVLTAEGRILHEKAHDPFAQEKRGGLLVARAMPVCSKALGLSGECDVVEFRASPGGVPLFGREGTYVPYPVEYKRGKPKREDFDIAQLTAQAFCLEEMLACKIEKGAMYYGEPRRRTEVVFTPELREKTAAAITEMHRLFARRQTPKVRKHKGCAACSLRGQCLPAAPPDLAAYYRENLEG